MDRRRSLLVLNAVWLELSPTFRAWKARKRRRSAVATRSTLTTLTAGLKASG